MPRWLGSVRVRTTLAATAVVGVVLVLAALALVGAMERSLIAGVETGLESRAGSIAELGRTGSFPSPLTLRGQSGSFTQVVGSSGRVLAAGDALQGRRPLGPFRPAGSAPVAWTERLTSDDELYRVVGVSYGSASGPVTIYAASSLEAASDSVTNLKSELVVGVPLLLLIVAATCWVMVGRTLRPVEAIRSEVAEIGLRALDRRVPEPPVRDEVGRLARTMNEMLNRLQIAAERERRFAAHASHELRSPLASLRTQLEVEREYLDLQRDRGRSIEDELAEVDRMERLVDDLLLLARIDERKLVLRSKPCRLDEIAVEEAERVAGADHVPVDTSRVGPATVMGDADSLARVLRNLLENATRHAASRVTVTLRKAGGRVELTVADDGPGIPVEARERVFERFTRLDEDRSRATGGAGLGLAIARDIVALHRGDIRVANVPSGACFVIDLPAANIRPSPPA